MAEISPSGGFYITTTGTSAATWGGYASASTTPVISAGTVNVYPTAAPKKRTPMEWLEDEVERICALTRPGLAA